MDARRLAPWRRLEGRIAVPERLFLDLIDIITAAHLAGRPACAEDRSGREA